MRERSLMFLSSLGLSSQFRVLYFIPSLLFFVPIPFVLTADAPMRLHNVVMPLNGAGDYKEDAMNLEQRTLSHRHFLNVMGTAI